MFFDNLAVFVVPLVCTLLFSLLSVHAFPRVPAFRPVLANVSPPSADLSSSEENDYAGSLGDLFSFDKRSLAATSNPFQLIAAMTSNGDPPISPSLQQSVESNPLMRAWLVILLQKLMEEPPKPEPHSYVFKYGRRRKWKSQPSTRISHRTEILNKIPFPSSHLSFLFVLSRRCHCLSHLTDDGLCLGQRERERERKWVKGKHRVAEWFLERRINTSESLDWQSISQDDDRWMEERGACEFPSSQSMERERERERICSFCVLGSRVNRPRASINTCLSLIFRHLQNNCSDSDHYDDSSCSTIQTTSLSSSTTRPASLGDPIHRAIDLHQCRHRFHVVRL